MESYAKETVLYYQNHVTPTAINTIMPPRQPPRIKVQYNVVSVRIFSSMTWTLRLKSSSMNAKTVSFFTDKKTNAPVRPHLVLDKYWKQVSVDLFSPMPSSKHVMWTEKINFRGRNFRELAICDNFAEEIFANWANLRYFAEEIFAN